MSIRMFLHRMWITDLLIRLYQAHVKYSTCKCFLGGSVSKESTRNAGDLGSIPGLGRSPGGGHGNPLQHSCLENPMNRGAWQAIVHGVAKSHVTEQLGTSGECNDKFSIIVQMIFPCCLQARHKIIYIQSSFFFPLSISDHTLISYDVPRSMRGSGVRRWPRCSQVGESDKPAHHHPWQGAWARSIKEEICL